MLSALIVVGGLLAAAMGAFVVLALRAPDEQELWPNGLAPTGPRVASTAAEATPTTSRAIAV